MIMKDKMYSIGKKYKFELLKRIFYTGVVKQEDNFSILIHSVRGEELILNKENIVQAKLMDSIGDKDGKY